ncbi:type I restriction enzyme, S subunit [Algoriphagus alkaliphilus]|uniref:Type I restriction enzyme, S subunit n=1 Tax=Algoriphagus alkaliphilus TaxID=279824 RepID=A0A1G5XN80_9BACT|nr:restriction endonuclease subunit S [Algoriphagus alkaliphilus]SDA71045.1 type I restriction enzyme, S subunit [Algoriphagus alkaliphilus]
MQENWITYNFSELFDISSGLSKSRDQFGFGHPFVTFKNVFYNFFLPNQLGELANTNEKERISGSVLKGDIFLTRTSETLHELGMSSVALKDYPNATFNGFCKRLRLKKDAPIQVDPVFIGYFLRSHFFRNEVTKHATMTTRASLNSTAIKTLQVTLPPYEEQCAIGQVLKPLDDKIELNLQMNKTLEEMAMTLYKHWFVDFGPFQDGNFVESELGLIPEGWEVKRLDEFYKNSQYGYTQSSSLEKIGPKFLRITDIQGGNVQWENVPYCISSDKDFEKYRIVKGDLFVARTGNSTGENVYILNAPEAVFASYLIRFQFDELFKSFYVAKNFRSKRFFDYVEGAKVGSAQPGISASTLGEFLLVIPPAKFLVDYFEKAFSFEERKEENLIENQTLTTLRDTLLPKLISGEVRVRDVEKQLSEVL